MHRYKVELHVLVHPYNGEATHTRIVRAYSAEDAIVVAYPHRANMGSFEKGGPEQIRVEVLEDETGP